MNLRLVLHPAARTDLAAIWDWTAANWGAAQAEAYVTGMRAAFTLLQSVPEMSRERAEISPPVRVYTYRSHVVIYRLSEDALVVHRIVHGRTNWAESLLD